MAKLCLTSAEGQKLKEISLRDGVISIGRMPDNALHIEDPAVSGYHARVRSHNGQYVLEDKNSTNGTWINGERVTRAVLRDGDRIRIGQQTVVFEEKAPDTGRLSPSGAWPRPAASPAAATTTAKQKYGRLEILSGKTEREEYVLSEKLYVIGKSEMASIRLTAWLAPQVAATVQYRDDKYFISPEEYNRIIINGEEITGRHELKEGDVIELAGITMAFRVGS
jgi:pSer/pThr/pTyr-binding forkhead associated (FHA) protein